jgi:hypothetical protein
MTVRSEPSRTLLRFEAVWSVTIAKKRTHNQLVRKLKALLQPSVKGSYAPTLTGKTGHAATVLRTSMEELDLDGSWPDW